MIVAMVVLGGIGHLPGVILGAILLASLPEVLRYVAGPLQSMTDGRLDASILRQLLIGWAMISVMLLRPRGLWPAPNMARPWKPTRRDNQQSGAPVQSSSALLSTECNGTNMTDTVLDVSGVSKRFGGLQALSDVGIKIERGQVYG